MGVTSGAAGVNEEAFSFSLFFSEREHEHVSGGEEQGERENLKQVPSPVQSPTRGAIPQPWDHDLS